jgi:hypothetical protein
MAAINSQQNVVRVNQGNQVGFLSIEGVIVPLNARKNHLHI